MKYLQNIQDASGNAEEMETIYHAACQAGEEAEFRSDLLSLEAQNPAHLLLAAWKARFARQPLRQAKRRTRWDLAILLGAVTGLILWALFDPDWMLSDHLPPVILLWAPVATLLAIVFLAVVSKQHYRRPLLVGLGLAAAAAYALLIVLLKVQKVWLANHYLDLMAIHLPLLCWIGLGLVVLGLKSSRENRFAFLTKSIEVVIAAGLYLIFGVAFGGITVGMFEALDIRLPEIIMRLIGAGGFGLLPLLALVTMYDPELAPQEQDFSQGLSKFIFTMMRLLLPLTLLVLVIYLFVIPFNFLAPFKNRDVLIVYNVMLFAILGLLMGATPWQTEGLSLRLQTLLRRGIIAVAALAMLISLYALAAVVYRTALEGLTINRTTIIGWNSINISILAAILYTQLRGGFEGWAERIQAVFSKATTAYLVWTIFLIVAIPLLFH
ncbi:MAG: hypothetical protein JW726_01175 [Anaerolineales bacterium]|nr:hypothetical protein [Anaerolineales bacterium]